MEETRIFNPVLTIPILQFAKYPNLIFEKSCFTPLLCDGVKWGGCPVPRVEDSTPWG